MRQIKKPYKVVQLYFGFAMLIDGFNQFLPEPVEDSSGVATQVAI